MVNCQGVFVLRKADPGIIRVHDTEYCQVVHICLRHNIECEKSKMSFNNLAWKQFKTSVFSKRLKKLWFSEYNCYKSIFT